MNRRVFLRGLSSAAIGASALGLLGARRAVPWNELAHRLQGKVLLPGDQWFAAYAQPNNLRYEALLPQAIALCKNAQDVRTSILFAREYDVPLVARSGGHSYAGYSTTSGLMIHIRMMNRLSFDANTGIATVAGGVRNANVFAALRKGKFAITHGRCPSVGTAGFVLGGGIGFNMRAHGVACDQLRATEIVTADGAIRTVRGNDDLFWACRGAGGGNFGIHTSFSFQTYEIAPLTVFSLTWNQRERVFERLLDVLGDAPATLGSRIKVRSSRCLSFRGGHYRFLNVGILTTCVGRWYAVFGVRILGQLTLQRAARRHADLGNALAMWRVVITAARWANFAQLKTAFPSADYVAPFTVFNVKGNKYRLIALVDYTEQVVVVHDILTHATYSKGKWK